LREIFCARNGDAAELYPSRQKKKARLEEPGFHIA